MTTQKLKLWQNQKLNCDNYKTQIVRKLKFQIWQLNNLNCDQTKIARKLKNLSSGKKSKTQIVRRRKINQTDKAQKHKL